MPLFRRKTSAPEASENVELPDALQPVASEPELPGTTGPFDHADRPDLGKRIDLGALRVPVVPELKLRLDINKSTGQCTGVALQLGQSGLQVQAFAAPKTWGVWDEIREELAKSITEQGGTVDDVPGTFGRELIARVPASGSQGQQTMRPARFIGVDGPRWFLRGVFSGKAAIDVEAATELEDLFRGIVVTRDDTPRPPRDLLPLSVPGQQLPGEEPVEAEWKPKVPAFDPLTRGPEITEIH